MVVYWIGLICQLVVRQPPIAAVIVRLYKRVKSPHEPCAKRWLWFIADLTRGWQRICFSWSSTTCLLKIRREIVLHKMEMELMVTYDGDDDEWDHLYQVKMNIWSVCWGWVSNGCCTNRCHFQFCYLRFRYWKAVDVLLGIWCTGLLN